MLKPPNRRRSTGLSPASAVGRDGSGDGEADIALCNPALSTDYFHLAITVCVVQRWGMESFVAIINSWPHPAKFAEDVGVTPALVAVWKTRDTIPAAYWSWVVAAAEKRQIDGISYTLLGNLRRAKR
jgi:hypothetical protein